MENAFAWLNKVFDYIWQFMPQLYHVKWTERAVRYRRGKFPVEVKPGVRWFWPPTTHVEKAEVIWSFYESSPTLLTTSDGYTIGIGQTIKYRISDIVKTQTSTDDFIGSLAELGDLPLAEIIASHTRQEIRVMAVKLPGKRSSKLNRLLTSITRRECEFLGVEIEYCRVHFDANARVIKLLQEEK